MQEIRKLRKQMNSPQRNVKKRKFEGSVMKWKNQEIQKVKKNAIK